MTLDSDVPNPDSRLVVKFYSKPMQNDYQTAQQGRPIFEDVDFIRINVPGDNTLTVDTPAREDHKARFPLHWAHYKNTKGDDQSNIGTPLSQWPILTASQAEELRALKFYTVESIATASDAQIQRIGMLAGMAPYAFRERAMRYLKVAQDESAFVHQDEELKALKAENERIKSDSEAKLTAMQNQINAILTAVQTPKRGRPAKKVPILDCNGVEVYEPTEPEEDEAA